MLVDDVGVYFDATAPSRMEQTIAAGVDGTMARRAEALRALWVESDLSKYNQAAEFAGDLPPRYVLVADQCAGDQAVEYGLATADSFTAMLDAALDENPDCCVIVKVHPEVLAGRRRGYLSEAALRHPRVIVIGDACHPIRLIDAAEAVYAVTSLMGFEGLLRDKPVRCFGMPFYAGWGLTRDTLLPPTRRMAGASMPALIHAALIAMPVYVDPDGGERWSAEEAIATAAAAFARLPERRAVRS